MRLRGLHLPAPDGHPALDGYRSFEGSRAALALALVSLQLRSRRRLLLFDHLGPARSQALLPRALRAPYAIQLHGIEVWRPLGRQARAAIAGASALIANSAHTARVAAEFLPRGAEPVVVRPGIEAPAPGGAPDRSLLAMAGSGFVLVVGRMSADERYKGHAALLEALALLEREGHAARLVVAGEGSDRRGLEARARELGVAGRVLFTGWVDGATLAALYRASSCLAMPSTGEGFGLVFLEAMAAERPWIALDGGAPAEIATVGEGGCLVSEAAPAALAAAMRALLDDPLRARRMGAAGRATWQREFTFDAFESRLRPLLERLVER